MKKRNLFNSFLFSMFTLGFYSIYWVVVMPSELASELGERRNPILDILFFFLTFGIYSIWLTYKSATYVTRIAEQRGEKTEDLTQLVIVLAFFGGAGVSQFLLQDKMNGFVEGM